MSDNRGELLSWLMFVATGIGPYSGQAVHFQTSTAPVPYAINRYRREAERLYSILNDRLSDRCFPKIIPKFNFRNISTIGDPGYL